MVSTATWYAYARWASVSTLLHNLDVSVQTGYPLVLPSNAIIVDTAAFERQLFASGQRHPYSIQTASGTSRQHWNAISLLDTLRSLGVAFDCKLHNAGNDAMMCLLALQLLLEPKTELPQHCWMQGREPPPVHSSQNARPTEPVYCMYGLYVVN